MKDLIIILVIGISLVSFSTVNIWRKHRISGLKIMVVHTTDKQIIYAVKHDDKWLEISRYTP